ncbi:MAG: RagB/SusD family nutrient uptake outer membrane protein [Bacteroidales bacterium]|nr:RagB/SusD family nutrient uptake outer membrane protein [Bacteroidales bacterium]
MEKKLWYILLSITMVISYSCKDFMTVEPEGYKIGEQTFETADDAINGVYGLYGMIQPLVDQIYLAGEAQGDLVLAARGADKYIAEIAQNRVTPQNPYTDFTNFYKLIVACNNALAGVTHINQIDPVNFGQEKYKLTVGEIKCIRAWTYLQLVKIWKDVPYVSEAITSVDQITAVAPEERDVILRNILQDVLDSYSVMQTARLNNTYPFADINKSRAQFTAQSVTFLLSDIYLHLGDYVNAYSTIFPILPYGERDNETLRGISPSLSPSYWYLKINGYFPEALYKEWCWYIRFDGSRAQTNSLQKWTNNKNGGVYALKPSANAIEYWNNTGMMLTSYQITAAGFYFNYLQPRGFNYVSDNEGYPIQGCMGDSLRGPGFSYQIDGKDTLIFKYIMKDRYKERSIQNGDLYSNDDAPFLIYRTGPFYLKTMEMLNNMGNSSMAYDFLNGGQGSEGPPTSTRSRVWCMPFRFNPNGESTQKQVNRFILEEMALEGAFEGLRWFDLVRFAERPGYESWLGDYISMKYPTAQREAIKTRLANSDYWYWPYYYKNVATNKLLEQKSGY